MKTAAIYARVSSDKQREENTIASQTAALIAFLNVIQTPQAMGIPTKHQKASALPSSSPLSMP